MSDIIRIPLGPSGSPVAWTTVDLADYERLIVHRWYLSGRGYAFRTNDGTSVFMHREILDFPDSEAVHHINDDKLDNRRANLEACTQAHNMRVSVLATVYPLRERICELRSQGWTNQAIADEIGTSAQTVSRYASHLPKAPHPNLVGTRQRLTEFVQQFYAQHGRQPLQAELDGKDGRPWFTTVYRRFDNLQQLIEAAGFTFIDGRSRRAA